MTVMDEPSYLESSTSGADDEDGFGARRVRTADLARLGVLTATRSRHLALVLLRLALWALGCGVSGSRAGLTSGSPIALCHLVLERHGGFGRLGSPGSLLEKALGGVVEVPQ